MSIDGMTNDCLRFIQELENARTSYAPRDLQLELEVDFEVRRYSLTFSDSSQIRIEQLEQEVETKERFIKTYTETVQDKEQKIVELLNNIEQVNWRFFRGELLIYLFVDQGDTSTVRSIEVLREQLRTREERIEQLLREKQALINEYEHRLSELETIYRDRERQNDQLNEKLRKSEIQSDVNRMELLSSSCIFVFSFRLINVNLKITVKNVIN